MEKQKREEDRDLTDIQRELPVAFPNSSSCSKSVKSSVTTTFFFLSSLLFSAVGELYVIWRVIVDCVILKMKVTLKLKQPINIMCFGVTDSS